MQTGELLLSIIHFSNTGELCQTAFYTLFCHVPDLMKTWEQCKGSNKDQLRGKLGLITTNSLRFGLIRKGIKSRNL